MSSEERAHEELEGAGPWETCPVTGQPVLSCGCGPHLGCPEHLLNCVYEELGRTAALDGGYSRL